MPPAKTGLPAALHDLAEGAALWPQWLITGNYDVLLRFRRSVLGPFWVTLSFAITIGALGVVYARVLHQTLHGYLPYLTIGLLLWTFTALTLQEGCEAFIAESNVLRQIYIPRSSCLYRVVWRNLLVLALNFTILPLVYWMTDQPLSPAMVWAVPGFLLFCANLAWVSFVFAILCTRFRDVSRIVASALQLLLLVTPVIWRDTPAEKLHVLALWNPLYHGIELVRAPLLGGMPDGISWTISLALAVCGWLLALLLFARYRWRITYWL